MNPRPVSNPGSKTSTNANTAVRRHCNIARLPTESRDLLNGMLHDGASYTAIIKYSIDAHFLSFPLFSGLFHSFWALRHTYLKTPPQLVAPKQSVVGSEQPSLTASIVNRGENAVRTQFLHKLASRTRTAPDMVLRVDPQCATQAVAPHCASPLNALTPPQHPPRLY